MDEERPTGAYLRRNPQTGEVEKLEFIIRPEDLVEIEADGQKEISPDRAGSGDRNYTIREEGSCKHT